MRFSEKAPKNTMSLTDGPLCNDINQDVGIQTVPTLQADWTGQHTWGQANYKVIPVESIRFHHISLLHYKTSWNTNPPQCRRIWSTSVVAKRKEGKYSPSLAVEED
jgi:hypothetical protein